MTAWDPFTIARRMRERDWEDDWGLADWDDTELDMYEEEDQIILKLKAPGFDDKNVDITIEDNSLTITGNAETEEEEKSKNKKYYRKEITQRSFTRTVSLPAKVIAEKSDAKFKNGILHITLPKAEESKPKKVSINVGQ